MNICQKVKEILKLNDVNKFKSLIDMLKYQSCKKEIEIRAIFYSCGMSPEQYDSFKQKIIQLK